MYACLCYSKPLMARVSLILRMTQDMRTYDKRKKKMPQDIGVCKVMKKNESALW